LNPAGSAALLYGALARAFPDQQIETVSVSDDGARAIGYGGIYDLELYSKYQDLAHPITRQLYVEQALGSDVADLKARSPIYNVDKIDIPVLLLHGEGNRDLHVVPAKRLMRALRIRRQSGETVEWMDLGWQPNPVYEADVRRKVCERILAFLDRNLK
jgi:dipeptidyl aminopeptidase/acylaminoacyl peptidase